MPDLATLEGSSGQQPLVIHLRSGRSRWSSPSCSARFSAQRPLPNGPGEHKPLPGMVQNGHGTNSPGLEAPCGAAEPRQREMGRFLFVAPRPGERLVLSRTIREVVVPKAETLPVPPPCARGAPLRPSRPLAHGVQQVAQAATPTGVACAPRVRGDKTDNWPGRT